MLQRMIKALRRNEGFTLLEVLVVIAILGIIAALLTPKFLETLKGARVDTAKASGKQIQMGLERYKFQNGAYPATEVDEADFYDYVDEYITLDAASGFDWPVDDAGYVLNTATTYTVKLVITGADTCLKVTPTAVQAVTLVAGSCTDVVAP